MTRAPLTSKCKKCPGCGKSILPLAPVSIRDGRMFHARPACLERTAPPPAKKRSTAPKRKPAPAPPPPPRPHQEPREPEDLLADL